MESIIGYIIFVLIAFVIPGVLTIWNIYNCCASEPKKEKLAATLGIIIGGIFYMLLHAIIFEEAGEWHEQIYTMQIHNSISTEYKWFVIFIIVFGLAGLLTLLFIRAEKLPPLISVLSIVALILLNIFQILYAIQITKNIDPLSLELLLYVYHANILILSAAVIRRQILQQLEMANNRERDEKEHKAFQWLYIRMTNLAQYTMVLFISLFFVIAILEIIFVLAGQGLDAPVKMFTDTADWTFSKQIPPPPLDYDGHYLCTVAAGGHKEVVKPLRLGSRREETIIVNRQLCIANAFEEVIQEKFPRFHHHIRHFYDTYGYPISRHITTPLRADMIYILMKPLEWVFLIFLYMVDLRPEQRINNQYKYRGMVSSKI